MQSAMRAAEASNILTARVPRLSASELARLLGVYGLSGTFKPLSGERDQNLKVTASDGRHYVLKIANAAEPAQALAFQNAALDHIAMADPDLPVPRTVTSLEGATIAAVHHDGTVFMARLVTHLPGEPALGFRATPDFRREAGRLAGRLDRALSGFRHSGGPADMIWDLRHAAALEDRIHHIADSRRRAIAEKVMANFKAHVVPALAGLRKQVIHNDLHQNNIMRGPLTGAITGIIDFGDMVETCLVNEAAIAIAHQLYREPDPLGVAAEFLSAYVTGMPLERAEVAVLFDLVQMRLLSREIITAWRSAASGGPSPYRADISEMGWEALSRALSINPEHASEHLEKAMTALAAAPRPTSTDSAYENLMARRRKAMGPMYKEFYQQPFMPVKGEGVWVTDTHGKRYLDAYNNVPHVGHCHPKVADAVARQVHVFNSNTRYPSELIVDYAERLTATMPDHLDTAMFVCSGTEANELAWRIATANTGGTGALVTDAAFHGNSTIIGALDTATLPHDRLEPWIGTLTAPRFAGAAGGNGKALSSSDYAATYAGAIAGLARRGHHPAAFFVCPVFASDGLYSAPTGYLDPAVAEIRRAGGLVIADEVQTALGRTGTHFWGFQHAGLVPDIVTMGKPMGNGIPLGVVVARRSLVEGFLQTQRYFNTFGGNQVAAAAGLAVLDVIETEKLQQSALQVGTYLRESLAGLMNRHGMIGDVRGTGLFAGVEVVEGDKPSRQRRAP
ncbi:aminotransferase class III-fold pyridoxal phosphate-dependent enzyme [Mesorhizobium sp. BAC0120]|uniref:aminotransferase class III-fold pyridoxal phosphate-dependent enzyme n=1 Tax=Mesorhizobium sp. BAC0120 TaxID=3090670 RepID=UPI00298CB6A1|nr:aminotransferase class III-fold pyridoxal phosphate-dependent enzyme [Mesorhizobium sp. BAC0120]MDW6023274.1 aminotransferase class III-fold pyridoxal phosphate-dependent enzyme [Mesorhizobium sp. BAC0120]